MSAVPAAAAFVAPPELSSEEIEGRLRKAILLAARWQLFVSSALAWLIAILAALSGGTPAPLPTLLLLAWVVLTSLALSALALRGRPETLTGRLPGRLALLSTIVTVLIAALLVRDASGDFYLIYFFPIAAATIYFGLRGGAPTAFVCAGSYLLLVLLFASHNSAPAAMPLLLSRVVFLLAFAGGLGVEAEGRLALLRELERAHSDLRGTVRALQATRETLARRNKGSRALERAAHEFTSTLDSARVLRLVLEQVEGLMGAEAATLMSLDESTNELVFQIPLGSSAAQLEGYRLPVGRGIAGLAAQSGQPMRVDNTAQDERHFHSVDQQSGFRTRSVLCVPMKLQGRVTGVLEVMNKIEGAFGEEDERLLTAVAEWAAIALENARLYHDLERSLRRLQEAQEQLVRAERLRALGEMANGVAHDFNNLLTIILAEAQLMMTRPHDERERRALERIEQAASDGTQAVRRIQEYTCIRRDLPGDLVNVDDLAQQAVEITRPRWQAATVSVQAACGCSTRGSPAELREVLVNLIFNALDARVEGRECRIVLKTAQESGRWVKLTVQDNGRGIPPEIRSRIFDPYFTTKPNGTGLGLSIAYGIITRHGGEIHVSSPVGSENDGGGTCFEIRLPLAESASE